MATDDKGLTKRSNAAEITAFIEQAKQLSESAAGSVSSGRLMFAMDATASRQPTWDSACNLQGEMFNAAQSVGNLQVQLCFYRGYQESRFSHWFNNAAQLHRAMQKVRCAGGLTQIKRVLRHALDEHLQQPISALVFVFQEGHDPDAEPILKEIARLSGGAWCRFDYNSAQQLRDLLSAVAIFAAGGRKALQDFTQSRPALATMVKQLTAQ